jgi:hypothetical protein
MRLRLRERRLGDLGQRGEGGRRREGKERGHRSRAEAGSELKVKDPGGDDDRSRDETGMQCGEGEATGKGGTGKPYPAGAYI